VRDDPRVTIDVATSILELSSSGRTRPAANCPREVEMAVRARLYGDRPPAGVTLTRRRPLATRGPAPTARRLANRYRVLQRVGAGGMATVYRARDERLMRDVAIKIIAEPLVRDPRAVRRFRREGQICARLEHPNIVAILDAGVVPTDFIVMELVEGVDVGSLLKRAGRPTAGEALHIVAQAAEALAHAHRRGVVHQDVSPHNILVRARDATVKLADFGLASTVDRAERSDTGGTPGYIAPEILAGGRPTPRADLYSLGTVASRLLMGADLPPALSAAIESATAGDPDVRHPSVTEFRAALLTAARAPNAIAA
jgi:eukaryotic-like serine/threonine-protein kinase